jgi:class 3 adenylate cyclase
LAAKTLEECRAEIEALRAEVERLRRINRGNLTGTLAVLGGDSSQTIAGLEEMIIEVKPDDTVGFVNTPMAKLLGIPDRKIGIGTPLAKWDHTRIGDNLLAALVDIVRNTREPHVLERSCPDLRLEFLPGQSTGRPTIDPIVRFVASEIKGRIHIVAQEVTKLRWLENMFSRYVSAAVIDRLQAVQTSDLLSMERRDLTILFGDLRGFTKMSQSLMPEEVQEVVNSFLSNMVDCVERLDGTVDKFVGDEIMVIFGAPVTQDDHALRALICSVEMQNAHQAWMREREAAGKPARPLGLGLATGPVVVGNVGTQSRMDYTVLGHTVNLAARLCGSAEGGEVLTIPHTHQTAMSSMEKYQGALKIPRMSFNKKGEMHFKNVEKPIEVLSVSAK